MIRTADSLTIHQLLGRVVYFHTLFIEPALKPSTGWPELAKACCNHGPTSGYSTIWGLLEATAWTAIDEVAAALSPRTRNCPQQSRQCCATCRVVAAGQAIAMAWAETEHRTYYGTPPAGTLLQTCGQTAAARLGRTFATQHGARCPVLDHAADTRTAPALPSPEDMPLTGELLALWDEPTATNSAPVVSWLNHCTGLDDIRRVLETRRTGT